MDAARIIRNIATGNLPLEGIEAVSARSVAASYKPPMLVTRVRLPACAYA
jgi:hypothetical protein